MQQACGRSDDYAEGVRAFLAKRPAEFTGKKAMMINNP
jgi:enoyl-CoA hydratase/carnithine racemase